MEDLLEIMERFELLQHLHKPLTDDERELHSRVESLSVHLRRSNAVLSDLSANAQSGQQVAQLQNMDQTGDQVKIDLALQGQRQALEKLVVHHNKDLRDIKIMMDHWDVHVVVWALVCVYVSLVYVPPSTKGGARFALWACMRVRGLFLVNKSKRRRRSEAAALTV